MTVTDKSNKRARDNIMDWHGIIQGVDAMQSEVAEDCDKESEENGDLEVQEDEIENLLVPGVDPDC